MASRKRRINTNPLDSITADMLGGSDDLDFGQNDSLRVERILLELVRPDPLQPRRVLPDRIYHAFHAQHMTPTQALRKLVQIAQLAARQQGRPFTNVLDLLGNPDDENSDDLPPLSPEEQLMRDLVNLAITIRDDGQVNPLIHNRTHFRKELRGHQNPLRFLFHNKIRSRKCLTTSNAIVPYVPVSSNSFQSNSHLDSGNISA